MNRTFSKLFALGTLALSIGPVCAAELNTGPNSYVGIDIGRSSFNTGNLGGPKTHSDETALAATLYGGYRINDHVGLEGGYARLGTLSETVTVDGTQVQQNARASSFYGAVTGRYPLSDAFTLTGKAGVSFGRVSASGGNVPASSALAGDARSLMLGIGAEYKAGDNLGITFGVDHFGKLSDKVSGANVVTAGVNYRF